MLIGTGDSWQGWNCQDEFAHSLWTLCGSDLLKLSIRDSIGSRMLQMEENLFALCKVIEGNQINVLSLLYYQYLELTVHIVHLRNKTALPREKEFRLSIQYKYLEHFQWSEKNNLTAVVRHISAETI